MLVAVVALAPVGVHATVLIPADLGELAREAIAIVRGRVVACRATWADDHRSIETVVTVRVDAWLKGSLGDPVSFRVPGGELGRYRSIFVGAPEFAIDDRVIVFLAAQGPAVPHVLGLSQGVFRLVPGHDGTGWLVTPPPLLPAAAATRVVRGDIGRQAMPLADFERHVLSLAGAQP